MLNKIGTARDPQAFVFVLTEDLTMYSWPTFYATETGAEFTFLLLGYSCLSSLPANGRAFVPSLALLFF